MLKRIIAVSLFMGLIPLSCGCPDTNDYYSTIQEFSIAEQVNFLAIEENQDLDSTDTLTFLFSVSKSTVVDNWKIGSFNFSNYAYALTQCPNDQQLGWANKVDSMKIVSNQNFNGIPAGTNIKDKFSGYTKDESRLNSPISISSLSFAINDFNGEIGAMAFGDYGIYLKLLLSEKPGSNSEHKFSFTFYSEGKILNKVESLEINFKP